MNYKKIAHEAKSLVLIALVVFACKSSLVCNYTVPTGSMRTTIEPGDKLLVNKMAYDLRIPFTKIRLFEHSKPKRGDVIVFECPFDPSLTFVKRLIGVPGDSIEISNGLITLNGKPLELSIENKQELEQLLQQGGVYQEKIDDTVYSVRRLPSIYDRTPPVKIDVPEGFYFAMGDNREESHDGRHWGLVPMENLWGQAKFVYFSAEWPTIRWERIGKGVS